MSPPRGRAPRSGRLAQELPPLPTGPRHPARPTPRAFAPREAAAGRRRKSGQTLVSLRFASDNPAACAYAHSIRVRRRTHDAAAARCPARIGLPSDRAGDVRGQDVALVRTRRGGPALAARGFVRAWRAVRRRAARTVRPLQHRTVVRLCAAATGAGPRPLRLSRRARPLSGTQRRDARSTVAR